MYLVLVSNVNLFIMIFWHWKQVTSSDKNVLYVIYCALRYLYMYILKSSTKVLHITGYGKNRKNTLDISRLPLVLHAKPLGRAIGWVDFYVLYMLYNNLFPSDPFQPLLATDSRGFEVLPCQWNHPQRSQAPLCTTCLHRKLCPSKDRRLWGGHTVTRRRTNIRR